MKKVFVTWRIPEEGLDVLKKEVSVEVNPRDRALTKLEIIEGVREKDGLLCLLTDGIDAEVMDASPNLKVISNYAVGYDNIDIKAATSRGIVVTNTPEVLTETTADFAWALLMACARRIAEADRFTREGKFREWSPTLLTGRDVHGKTLGILGLGRIGSAVARRGKGFNMKILYTGPRRKRKLEKELGVKYVSKEKLLKESDFVTLHVPLLPTTYHLIGERELKLMKPSAYLINTSRGPVVDESALVVALKKRTIAGAGLDVYEKEPELMEGLAQLDNVVLSPHIASATIETRTRMAMVAAQNVLAALKGTPINVVNFKSARGHQRPRLPSRR
ncbi:MAG: D-glycerate dehydrogenase [Euryarchaeota archaeon]|nr:D-glycerate dehydrogenase [Euryarchaeota archaeon]